MLTRVIFVGLFLVPFIPLVVSSAFLFPFITAKAFAFRIIVEVIFVAWILLALSNWEYRPKRSWLVYSIALFIAVIGVANSLGVAPVKSFWSNVERMEGFVSLLHLGMFYVVAASVLSAADWLRWWNTSLAASLIVVGYSTLQLLGILETRSVGGARIDGTFGSAPFLAVYLLFHMFIASFFLAGGRDKNWRWFYIAALIANSVVLYTTATRGAVLGVLGGAIITALLSLSNNQKPMRNLGRACLAGVAVLVIAFFAFKDTSFVQQSRLLARFSAISFSDWTNEGRQGRAFVWPIAVQGIQERPILGWGQENFNYVFNSHYSGEMFRLEAWFDRAHNVFLDWGISGGLVGLTSYLLLYLFFLHYLWKRGSPFDYAEKSVLTGLLAAYFFHNLFVFDHLVSYVLFMGLLAFVTACSDARNLPGPLIKEAHIKYFGAPIAVSVLVAVLYFINVQPILANISLNSALENLQSSQGIARLKKGFGDSRLGRMEAIEQIVANAAVLLNGPLPVGDKNEFYRFAQTAVENQAKEFPTDARYQKLAGDFFVRTGKVDLGIEYLNKAIALMPKKQALYFDVAAGQSIKNDYRGALASLKSAFDLAPEYELAHEAYLIGAIYAGDTMKESELLASIRPAVIMERGYVLTAYYRSGRYDKLISVLRDIQGAAPQYASEAESLIKQIPTNSR